jgi:hypothetical protein
MARQVPLPFGNHSFYDEAPGSSGPMQTPSIAFRYAILHATGNCTHFLTPLMAMIWIIGQQAWHEGPVWALEPNLAAELAHSNFAIIARGGRGSKEQASGSIIGGRRTLPCPRCGIAKNRSGPIGGSRWNNLGENFGRLILRPQICRGDYARLSRNWSARRNTLAVEIEATANKKKPRTPLPQFE